MIADAGATVLMTDSIHRLQSVPSDIKVVDLSHDATQSSDGAVPTSIPGNWTPPGFGLRDLHLRLQTGTPKGVQVEHRSVVNLIMAIPGALGLSAADTYLGGVLHVRRVGRRHIHHAGPRRHPGACHRCPNQRSARACGVGRVLRGDCHERDTDNVVDADRGWLVEAGRVSCSVRGRAAFRSARPRITATMWGRLERLGAHRGDGVCRWRIRQSRRAGLGRQTAARSAGLCDGQPWLPSLLRRARQARHRRSRR